MKKRFALAALLMMLVVVLSGCNLIGHDDALDDAQVVATVNGTEITKGEWKSYRDYMASYYQQYFQQMGYSMQLTDEMIESYGDTALDQMVQNIVVDQKMEELGLTPLTEEETTEVESYADSMFDMYKLMMRYQNYPNIETVEEEAKRLADEAAAKAAAATADEATPAESTPDEPEEESEPAVPQATITDAVLDEMLTKDLAEYGYTREYFIENRTATVEDDKLHDYINQDVKVEDDAVKAEFDNRVNEQKETYDATPTAYLTAVNSGSDVYYVPAGYRGVKNLLIGIPDDVQSGIDEIDSALSSAQTAVTTAQSQLDSMLEEDASDFDEETLTSYNEQKDTLEKTISENQAIVDAKTAELAEAKANAMADVKVTAEEVLEKAKAGEDFDALIETYGTDPGMKSEPNKTRGYLVCEGLSTYDQNFQDAAMALGAIGDISDLVETEFGYHILKYAEDIESGAVEYTDEIKESLHDTLLESAQSAAYDAAIDQWVVDADVKTYPKIMK